MSTKVNEISEDSTWSRTKTEISVYIIKISSFLVNTSKTQKKIILLYSNITS